MSAAPTTPAEESVQEYLRARLWFVRDKPIPEGWSYKGPHDLLMQHGTFYDPSVILPDEWSGVITAYPKYCFDNAYRLARASKGRLRYVEGVALRFIPCDHAWCITEDGTVVDPTWAELDGDIKPSAYFGIVIPLPVMVRARRRPEGASALFGWGPDSELLYTQPYTPDLVLPEPPKPPRRKRVLA
jgi:hypothetical protein